MRRLLLVSFALVAMLIIGCGGVSLLQAPEIIGVLMEATSVRVTWEADPNIEDDEDFQGYNVYVYTDSTELLVENGEDLNPHNATVITDNFYTAQNLSQDSVYYIQVRTVNSEDNVGDYNAAVPFVTASPRPGYVIAQLKLELQDAVVDEDSCALKFETGEILDEVNGEFPNADVFADKIDADSAQIVTASARPNGRSTLVAKLDTTVYSYDDWDFSEYSFGTDDRQVVRDNDLLLCMTEEGNYVKVLIGEVNLTLNYIALEYAYQNLIDFPYLAP